MHPYAWPTESDAFALVPALSLAYYLVVRRRRVEAFRIACFVLAMLLQRFTFVDHTGYRLRVRESVTIKPEGLTMTVRPRAGRTGRTARGGHHPLQVVGGRG